MNLKSFEEIPWNPIVEKYYHAVVKLVESQPIASITVQDILQETNTARPTFYRYFSDKYELMNFVYYHDMSFIIDRMYTSYENYKKYLCIMFEILQEKNAYYKRLCAADEPNYFKAFLGEFWTSMHKKACIDFYGQEKWDKSLEYIINAYAMGLANAYTDWQLSNCSSCTPEEMAEIYYRRLPQEMIYLLNDKNKLA